MTKPVPSEQLLQLARETGVPEGTSMTSTGTSRRTISNVRRTPSPVMLRQIGKSSVINRRISLALVSTLSPRILEIMNGDSYEAKSG